NAANLLLNRAGERGHELAIRTALGAGRNRLIWFLLNESALLATMAGALGLLLADAGIQVLVRLAPADVPRVGQAGLDPLVLAFGTAATVLTVVLFGVGPAPAASRRDPYQALKLAGRGSAGRARPRWQWL